MKNRKLLAPPRTEAFNLSIWKSHLEVAIEGENVGLAVAKEEPVAEAMAESVAECQQNEDA
jgi:hypothetical protein